MKIFAMKKKTIYWALAILLLIVLAFSLYYHPYGYRNVKERLRIGFHKVQVSSEKAAITAERTIFLLFNQHITIEFHDTLEPIRDRPEFDIWVNSNQFYYE